MRSYKNILNLFPFIGKDFYYYSHPDCDLFRLRSFNDKQIFCDLRCANISNGLSLNTLICDITFKKKASLFSKQRTCYKDIYELSFYKHFIIEKIKVDNIYKITVYDEQSKLITTTYTKDPDIHEPSEFSEKVRISTNRENINYEKYNNKNGPAIIITDLKGNVLEEYFIVNGNKMSEFEFEIYKATKN